MINGSTPQQQLTHFELFPPVIKLPVSFFCSFLSSTALVVSSLKIIAGYEDDMYAYEIKSCLGFTLAAASVSTSRAWDN